MIADLLLGFFFWRLAAKQVIQSEKWATVCLQSEGLESKVGHDCKSSASVVPRFFFFFFLLFFFFRNHLFYY